MRSALYLVGAMKGLYDAGLMNRTTIVSAVSGGSYAAYWMYANHHKAGGSRFDADSFDDDVFGPRMCTLIRKARLLDGVARVAKGAIGGGARQIYENGIRDAFGTSEPSLLFNQLTTPAANAPFLIINATRRDRNADRVAWPSQTVEFTPFGKRTDDGGFDIYKPWDEHPLPVSEAVAVSGAIAPFLYRKMKIGDTAVTVSDGGHTENLGALALVRRGVRRIFIIDAEMDLNEPLGAYVKLRDGLRANGYILSVHGFENRTTRKGDRLYKALPRSINKGWIAEAKTGDRVSQVYYMKMARADDAWLRPTGSDDDDAYLRLLTRLTQTNRRPSSDCSTERYDRKTLETLLRFAAHRYAAKSDKSAGGRAGSLLPEWAQRGFPRYTTFDPNWSADRALAFIGLGYAQAIEACMGDAPELCPSGIDQTAPQRLSALPASEPVK